MHNLEVTRWLSLQRFREAWEFLLLPTNDANGKVLFPSKIIFITSLNKENRILYWVHSHPLYTYSVCVCVEGGGGGGEGLFTWWMVDDYEIGIYEYP